VATCAGNQQEKRSRSYIVYWRKASRKVAYLKGKVEKEEDMLNIRKLTEREREG